MNGTTGTKVKKQSSIAFVRSPAQPMLVEIFSFLHSLFEKAKAASV
jgi:hypothetical protein